MIGNLFSILLRSIVYVLRFLFPRFTTRMLEGYNPVPEDKDNSALSINTSFVPQTSDSVVQEQVENDNEISSGENIEGMRSTVKYFFTIHDLHKRTMIKTITKKFLKLSGKANIASRENTISQNTSKQKAREGSRPEEREMHPAKSRTVSSSEKISNEIATNQQDKGCKESDLNLVNERNSVDIDGFEENKYPTESVKVNIKCIDNQECRRKKITMVSPSKMPQNRKEMLGDFKSSLEKISSNDYSNDGHKSTSLPSREVFQDGCEKFLSSLTGTLPNDVSNDEFFRDVEIGRKKELSLRKISLNRLYSGSHYVVINDDKPVEILDYSTECTPLPIEAEECVRKFTTSKLLSGGTVILKEFSDHLSIPNWYNETR